MTQPKITTEQIDNDSLFPVGSGAQIQSVSGEITAQSGSSTFDLGPGVPVGGSPAEGGGVEIGHGQISRTYDTSKILIQFSITLDCNTNNTSIIVGIFRGDICIGTAMAEVSDAKPTTVSMTHVDLLGGGSPLQSNPVTYSGRIGTPAGTETWYVNQTKAGDTLGGTMHTSFVLTELK